METLQVKKPRIVAKISKVSNLLEISNKAKKTSTKLRKTFEKGIYQKRTQLSILNRYKKRLKSITEESDRKLKTRKKSKIKLPLIKKFAGNFFTANAYNDPFKAIAALAGFNAATKATSGDWLGALGPALVAGGFLFGPGLIKSGVSGLSNKFFGPKVSKGFDTYGRRVSKSSQERYLNRYGEKAFKNRFGRQNLRNIKSLQAPEKLASQSASKLGKSAIIEGGEKAAIKSGSKFLRALPFLGAAFSAISAYDDIKKGNWIGAGLNIVAGVSDLFGLTPLALGATAAAIGQEFAYDNDPKNKLKEQEKKQKESVKKKGDLSFQKVLDRYESVIDKFSRYVGKGFVTTKEGIDPKYADSEEDKFDYATQGENLNLTGTGDEVFPLPSGNPVFNTTTGNFFSPRSHGQHNGQDIGVDPNSPVVAASSGKVVDIYKNYGNVGDAILIQSPDGQTRTYGHVSSKVKIGDSVNAGQPIGNVTNDGGNTHLHYMIKNASGSYIDPLPFLRSSKYLIEATAPDASIDTDFFSKDSITNS